MTVTPTGRETQMSTTPTTILNNGVEIPQIGFGVYQIEPKEVRAATEDALAAGYRHIDTAAAYQNEAGVGSAVRESGIPREEIFVTTKLRNADQGYDNTLRAFDESQATLGLDVIDLYLIHWPYPRHNLYVESWKALEFLHAEGRVRSIGVSNFCHRTSSASSRRVDRSGGESDRDPSHVSADLARCARRIEGHSDRVLQPPGPGRRSCERHGALDREGPRCDPCAGRAALASAARTHRHPQVGHA